MKKLKFFNIFFICLALAIAGCGKEENKGTCSDGIKNQDETGIDCGGTCGECREGVQGTWHSYPVAPILAAYADSINATFNTNFTYTVEQYKSGNKITLTGTYTQSKSNVGNIWNITVNQTAPTAITATGIFEVSADNKTMKYEIVQTEPALGVAPATPEGGFGSTAGGALGTQNVQSFTRRN